MKPESIDKSQSNFCSKCQTKLILLDKHYKLPACYDFIYLCPKHPGKLYFDMGEIK